MHSDYFNLYRGSIPQVDHNVRVRAERHRTAQGVTRVLPKPRPDAY